VKAHRLSTMRDANVIIVVNRDPIVEQGGHHALMASRGLYLDRYNCRFAGAAT
jgi:ATP-binding cassette subfamily B protein